MKLILTSAAVILASIAFTPRANAQLVDVDFSFNGAYGGTVTGELLGLNANGTSAPTDVIIFSGTSENSQSATSTFTPAVPFDFGAENPVQNGKFTLVNGTVTDVVGGFQITENSVDQIALQLDFGNGGGGAGQNDGVNELVDNATQFYAENAGGFGGVTFGTATPAVVPEPSAHALALLGAGVFAMLVAIRRQRAKA